MWLILAGMVYLVGTGVAIYTALDQGCTFTKKATFTEKCIRMFWLLTIGWILAIVIGICYLVMLGGMWITERTIQLRFRS